MCVGRTLGRADFADRTARVKEARSEAAKEIDALKAKRDQEQRDREQEGSGEADKGQEKLDKETTEQIDGLKSLFERNRDDVVKVLLDRLVEVRAAGIADWQR